MRISDCSSDVCSSDLRSRAKPHGRARQGSGCSWTWNPPGSMHDRRDLVEQHQVVAAHDCVAVVEAEDVLDLLAVAAGDALQVAGVVLHQPAADATALPADQVHQRVVAEITLRSEEQTSELQSLMRTQY